MNQVHVQLVDVPDGVDFLPIESAREMFEAMLECRNSLGLLSEDLNTESHELWGNFPQTYSMVGIINSARILSESWESAL